MICVIIGSRGGVGARVLSDASHVVDEARIASGRANRRAARRPRRRRADRPIL